MERVVPGAMPLVSGQRERLQFLVGDDNTLRIEVGVEFGADGESGFGGGSGDEFHDCSVGGEWTSPPVHRDEAEHPVFDLVPLRRAWWIVDDGDLETGVDSELGQFD